MELVLDNVCFGYSRRKPVLDIADLTVSQFPLAVLGPNGAGKSTLLSLLAGRYPPHRGRVAFHTSTGDESDRPDLRQDSPQRSTWPSPRDLRDVSSWAQQEARALRGFTVREQVAYCGWLKGMRYRQAWRDTPEALRAVGLETLERSATHQLSGGQRRRLSIAGAIVSRPKVLLLDEPYAGLDPEQRTVLRDTLRELRTTTALVVSTHQTDGLDDVYESVIVLNEGRLLFSGDTEEFLAAATAGTHSSDGIDRAEFAYRRLLQNSRGSGSGNA